MRLPFGEQELPLRRVVQHVPRDEEAQMLKLRAPEGALVEHRDVLVADADSDRGTRRRACRERRDDRDQRERG